MSTRQTVANLPGALFWFDSHFLPSVSWVARQAILWYFCFLRRRILILWLLLSFWVCFDDQIEMLLIFGENLVPDAMLARVTLWLFFYPTALLRLFTWRAIIEWTTHACIDRIRRSCGVSTSVISSCWVCDFLNKSSNSNATTYLMPHWQNGQIWGPSVALYPPSS